MKGAHIKYDSLTKLACDRASEKKKSHVAARMEITRRLVSAGLKVKTVLNTSHTEIHVLVSANLERLEAEAEATGVIHSTTKRATP
jgi:hypothetical protein